MRRFFKPVLLEPKFRIIENSGDKKLDDMYSIPFGSIGGVIEYLKTLPVEDAPEVFGLDPNADINFQQNERNSLLQRVIMLGGGGGGGGGDTAGADAKVAAIAESIEKRVPALFDARQDKNTEAHPSTFERSDLGVNSLGVFLSQELVRFNELISVMKSTLFQLQRAIKGIVVMSGPLEAMYNAFLFQQQPPAWEKAGYPCLKPLASWVEDHFGRLKFMGDWLRMGPQPAYWLPAFFFPQGAMTSVKQTCAQVLYRRRHAAHRLRGHVIRPEAGDQGAERRRVHLRPLLRGRALRSQEDVRVRVAARRAVRLAALHLAQALPRGRLRPAERVQLPADLLQ